MWLSNKNKQYDPTEMCVICQESFGVEQAIYQLDECKHKFHTNCLHEFCKTNAMGSFDNNYREMKCPLCRKEVPNECCVDVDNFVNNRIPNIRRLPSSVISIYNKQRKQDRIRQDSIRQGGGDRQGSRQCKKSRKRKRKTRRARNTRRLS